MYFRFIVLVTMFSIYSCYTLAQSTTKQSDSLNNDWKIHSYSRESTKTKCNRIKKTGLAEFNNRLVIKSLKLKIGSVYTLNFKCKVIKTKEKNAFFRVQCNPRKNSKETGVIYEYYFNKSNEAWMKFSVTFYVREKLQNIEFSALDKSILQIDSLVLFQNNLEEKSPQNLVINPGFDFFSRLPDKRFNGTPGLYFWQTIKTDSCIQTRTRTTADFVIENNEVSVLSEIMLGSADFVVESFNSTRVNCSGRLGCDNYKFEKGVARGEFLESKLRRPLIKDSAYILEFDYKLDSTSKLACNGLGVKLTKCPFAPFDKELFEENLPHTPTFLCDSKISFNEEWLRVKFIYKAKGGEEYITFGPFSENGEIIHERIQDKKGRTNDGSYYLIDNILFLPYMDR